uniref:Uncharacterized protein n=1 Tax=Manihot esculenta TaxID=3983 RepID=A0A2C9UEZ4_MANES
MEDHREISIHSGFQMDNKESGAQKKGNVKQSAAENERRDINELADAFIKNFHSRLKIQCGEFSKR